VFNKGDLSELKINGSDFVQCDFSEAGISGVKIIHSVFKGCSFVSSIGERAIFNDLDLSNCNFDKVKADYSEWQNCRITVCSFRGMVLDKITMRGSYKRNDFQGASGQFIIGDAR